VIIKLCQYTTIPPRQLTLVFLEHRQTDPQAHRPTRLKTLPTLSVIAGVSNSATVNVSEVTTLWRYTNLFTTIRPRHYAKRQKRTTATHVAWSACLSVGHEREPCKNGRTDRAAFWGLGWELGVGPWYRVLSGDPDQLGKGHFWGGNT